MVAESAGIVYTITMLSLSDRGGTKSVIQLIRAEHNARGRSQAGGIDAEEKRPTGKGRKKKKRRNES